MEIKKTVFESISTKLLADFVTPVGIYLKIRDQFSKAFLLESSDYHGQEHSFSYLCFDPVANISLDADGFDISKPEFDTKMKPADRHEAMAILKQFSESFESNEAENKFVTNGLFGYMSYDAVQYFEDIQFDASKKANFTIPLIQYSVFRFVIAFDHFRNEVHVFQHRLSSDESPRLDEIVGLINKQNVPSFDFNVVGEESSNLNDEEHRNMIQKGIDHCHLGDVFQIVLARQFKQSYEGDDFQVYRALRSINPSPYLFYFDYGSFKIFGSSPEAQIVIKGDEATIYPIAGTVRRTGDDQADAQSAERLSDDPKENSEHLMLVDLARNDLSRKSDEVEVKTFKEVQYYSHVIHLVSRVTGQLSDKSGNLDMVASTFPAGTLSGAPKHMAMQLIDKYETVKRGYYGGAIGYMGFNGDFNHAIMIRSLLSQGNNLFYQAGGGIVAKSSLDGEVQEVYNKIGALRSAIKFADEL